MADQQLDDQTMNARDAERSTSFASSNPGGAQPGNPAADHASVGGLVSAFPHRPMRRYGDTDSSELALTKEVSPT